MVGNLRWNELLIRGLTSIPQVPELKVRCLAQGRIFLVGKNSPTWWGKKRKKTHRWWDCNLSVVWRGFFPKTWGFFFPKTCLTSIQHIFGWNRFQHRNEANNFTRWFHWQGRPGQRQLGVCIWGHGTGFNGSYLMTCRRIPNYTYTCFQKVFCKVFWVWQLVEIA